MTLSKLEQDRLVSQHYEYAKKQARIFNKKIAWLEHDDLTQEAALALVSAAESYDPSSGVSFVTFCTPIMNWRMLDYAKRQARISRRDDQEYGERAVQMWAVALRNGVAPPEQELGELNVEWEAALTQKDLDRRLDRFPHLQRRLIGHTIVDMGKVEKVAPSTIFRRMQKELAELSAEVATDNPPAGRKQKVAGVE